MTGATASPFAGEVAVVGGGPAGLAAAEAAAGAGASVTLYDRMPSVGRKFLLAGRGGLNLTHSESCPAFLARYGEALPHLRPALEAFGPDALREWADGLGADTFVGSSGRVFPRLWKASPLLRAWLARLDGLGVRFATRHRWIGFGADPTVLVLAGPDGAPREIRPHAAVLALGGASWPRLGADGSWTAPFGAAGLTARPLRPANVALRIEWSPLFRERFAGAPLKRIALGFAGRQVRGEAVVTADGLEGGVVYALSGTIRDALAGGGPATLRIDLRPDLDAPALAAALARPRGKRSLSTFLGRVASLAPAAIALLREACGAALPAEPGTLAALIKAVPLPVVGTGGLDRAISTAGGLRFDQLDGRLMLRGRPGVFIAGEMLDWDAPTGGYLLQACLATGRLVGDGAADWARIRG